MILRVFVWMVCLVSSTLASVYFESNTDTINSFSFVKIKIDIDTEINDGFIDLKWSDSDELMTFVYDKDNVITFYTNKLVSKPIHGPRLLTISNTSIINSKHIESKSTILFENSCAVPFDHVGYDVSECIPDDFDMTKISKCNIKCLEGAGDDAIVSCLSHQDEFIFEGCSKRCRSTDVEGYDISECEGLISEKKCNVKCADNWIGTATRTCATEDDIFDFEGCDKQCVITPTEGYDLSKCTTEVEDGCIVSCTAGYVNVGLNTRCENGVRVFEGCELPNCENSVQIECDDNVPCTTDICDVNKKSEYESSHGCHHVPSHDKCNDGFECTTNVCTSTGCKIIELDDTVCDDGYSCTTDKCISTAGCEHYTHDSTCNDNNVCTTDSCTLENGCIHTQITCDDNDVCTTDSCDTEKGCTYNEKSCDDDIVCTIDTCDSISGCDHKPDDTLCHTPDKCTVSTCDIDLGCNHAPIVCDDGIPCTIDSCDPTTGCIFTPIHSLCKDEYFCTEDVCSEKEGCLNIKKDSKCYDGFLCTQNTCVAEPGADIMGCHTELNDDRCQDGAKCSTNVCNPKKSTDKTGCENTYYHYMCHDDKNACTFDTCNPASVNSIDGCSHIDMCEHNNIDCTLNLEIDQYGNIKKPTSHCMTGSTFYQCDKVQVTLYKHQLLQTKHVLTSTALPAVLTPCTPNPCINATCTEIIEEYVEDSRGTNSYSLTRDECMIYAELQGKTMTDETNEDFVAGCIFHTDEYYFNDAVDCSYKLENSVQTICHCNDNANWAKALCVRKGIVTANCTCPDRQKGERCEFRLVEPDKEEWSWFFAWGAIIVGISLGGYILCTTLPQLLSAGAIEVAVQLPEIMEEPKSPRKEEKKRFKKIYF